MEKLKKGYFAHTFSDQSLSLETVANRYAMRSMFILMIAITFVWLLDILGIFIIGLDVATFGTWSANIVIILCLIIIHFLRTDNPVSKYIIITSIVLSMTLIGIGYTYQAVLGSVFPILFTMMYSDKKLTRYTYCLMIVSTVMVVYFGFNYGLLDANMLLQTQNSLKVHMEAGDLLDHMYANTFADMMLYYAMPRILIYFTMGSVCNNISNILVGLKGRADNMQKLAEIDTLTQTVNRATGERLIKNTLEDGIDATYCMVDIDNFKIINDTYGHSVGDAALRMVVSEIKKYLGPVDLIVRVGGDEFGILLVGLSGRKEVGERLHLICKKVNELELKLDDDSEDILKFSVSIGAVIMKKSEKVDYSMMCQRSDAALYEVKENGKNGFRIYKYNEFDEK